MALVDNLSNHHPDLRKKYSLDLLMLEMVEMVRMVIGMVRVIGVTLVVLCVVWLLHVHCTQAEFGMYARYSGNVPASML